MIQPTLIRCASCPSPAHASSFPLCPLCLKSLRSDAIQTPVLCPHCASPACPPRATLRDPCQRPWLGQSGGGSAADPVAAYHARYLLIDPAYSILKRWKLMRGPLFDYRVLNLPDRLACEIRARKPELIVPIPQRYERSWQLRGSPAERVARWLSSELALPTEMALRRETVSQKRFGPSEKRQAELDLQDRYLNPITYRLRKGADSEIHGKNILLVDDFMTTGHTLRAAARALKLGGSATVQVFCLGIRPAMVHQEVKLFESA